MLNFMRTYMNKWVLGIIIAIIAIVFIFFDAAPGGMMGGGGGIGTDAIARVGGEKVTVSELEQAVNRELENYGATGEMAQNLRKTLRMQTLNSLIQNKLFLIEAKRMGIMASNSETAAEIQQMPYFQDKEKKTFSVDLYKSLLEANRLTPAQFEENVRQFLIQRKMSQFLENRIRVTDEEVRREYTVSNEKRSLNFVRVSKDNAFKQMKVSSEDLQKFLSDESKNNLIQTNYVQNKQKYDREEEICARHILKRVDKDAKPEETAKPPKTFTDLKPTVNNFSELAKKHSEDPGSGPTGGDLGCFGRGMMDKAFEEAAFKLGVSQVSSAIKSSFGWHYILVYKKNPAVKIPLEKVKNEIAEELIKRERLEEVRKINRAQSEAIARAWGKTPAGFTMEETPLFNALDGFIPKIGRADELLRAAFDSSAAIQKGPQVFESQGSFIVASVKERKTADVSKFDEQKVSQERAIRARKMQAFMPAWMQYVQKSHKIKIDEKLLSRL